MCGIVGYISETRYELDQHLIAIPNNCINRKKAGFNPPLDNIINNIGISFRFHILR